MRYSNFLRGRPSVGNNLRRTQTLSYKDGINTFVADEDVPQNQLRWATDARMQRLGQYATKKGFSFYTDAAGETVNDQETSTTGAADRDISKTTWRAIKFTATATGRLTKFELRIKDGTSPTGAVRIDIYSDSSGEPGSLMGSTSIPASEIDGSYAYEVSRLVEAPSVSNTSSYWAVIYIQDNGSGTYQVSSTTNATTSLVSTDAGVTWATTTYDINFKTYISTDSKTLGAYRAYKSTGDKKTLVAHGTNVYTVTDGTGALTSIKSALSSSATDYYFEKVNDVVYYVNGFDAPRKWDFTTEAAMGGTPATASNIKLHKNQLMFVDATDKNKIFWSDIGDFETFTSTNFLYVPSPKADSPITAWETLNGIMYVSTGTQKYALYGDDLATFDLAPAPAIKPFLHQKSVVKTRNFIYFVSDDGIYRFDGTTDKLISAEITNIIEDITDKSKCRMWVGGNRIYIAYPSTGFGYNNRCLVYNLDYEVWESVDLDVFAEMGLQFNSEDDNGEFVVFSNLVGQAFYAEADSNNYSNAGKPLQFELRTRYDIFSTPESLSRIKRLYARFRPLSTSYDVNVYYDTDYRDSPQLATSVDLIGSSSTWGGGAEWGDGTTWGSTRYIDERISIPTYAQAVQRRYSRTGVDTPVWFTGEVVYVKQKRAR